MKTATLQDRRSISPSHDGFPIAPQGAPIRAGFAFSPAFESPTGHHPRSGIPPVKVAGRVQKPSRYQSPLMWAGSQNPVRCPIHQPCGRLSTHRSDGSVCRDQCVLPPRLTRDPQMISIPSIPTVWTQLHTTSMVSTSFRN